jgi:anti-sigma factor RsiW
MSALPITEDDIQAYVDGVLESARQAEVAAYLESHPDVGQRVQGYIRDREQLRAKLAPMAEEPIPAKLNLLRLIDRRQRFGRIWRQAAAAIILLGIGGGTGWSLHGLTAQPATAGIAALAQEAAYSYAVYAPDHMRPVEIRASDQPELVDWASRRLNRRVTVPDLSQSGYRFMGGGVVATAHGAAVLYMYDNDHGTRLVMLTRLMAIDQNTAMKQSVEGSVVGFTWAGQGVGYSLVGPVPPETLHAIANEARRQIQEKI